METYWAWRILRFTLFLALTTLLFVSVFVFIYYIFFCFSDNCFINQINLGFLFPAVLLACWWEFRREGVTFTSIGLAFHSRWWQHLIIAILAGMTLMPLALSITAITKATTIAFHPLTLQVLTKQVGLGFLIGSSTALAEELVFRGFLLSTLCTRFRPVIALGISSLLFGVLHLPGGGGYQFSDLLWLIFAGIFLGLLYLRTGSLWFSIGAHAGYLYGIGVLSALNINLSMPASWTLDVMLAFMFGIAALIVRLLPLAQSQTDNAKPLA